jgi:periplasmic protein CpxP/Spy
MLYRIKVFTASLAVALCAAMGYAQQQPNTTQNQTPETKAQQRRYERADGRGFGQGQGRSFRERGPRGLFDPRLISELNLTDDQQRQIGQIVSSNFENTKTQREQLHELMQKRMAGTLTPDDEARAKTLREQLQSSMKDGETKIAAVLTPEQKTKLEEIIKERRENRRFGDRRRGVPGGPDRGNSRTQKPSSPIQP